jgi:hypothetical protein
LRALVAYRRHLDIQRVFGEMATAIVLPLKLGAYFLGTLDRLADHDLEADNRTLPTNDPMISGICGMFGTAGPAQMLSFRSVAPL